MPLASPYLSTVAASSSTILDSAMIDAPASSPTSAIGPSHSISRHFHPRPRNTEKDYSLTPLLLVTPAVACLSPSPSPNPVPLPNLAPLPPGGSSSLMPRRCHIVVDAASLPNRSPSSPPNIVATYRRFPCFEPPLVVASHCSCCHHFHPESRRSLSVLVVPSCPSSQSSQSTCCLSMNRLPPLRPETLPCCRDEAFFPLLP